MSIKKIGAAAVEGVRCILKKPKAGQVIAASTDTVKSGKLASSLDAMSAMGEAMVQKPKGRILDWGDTPVEAIVSNTVSSEPKLRGRVLDLSGPTIDKQLGTFYPGNSYGLSRLEQHSNPDFARVQYTEGGQFLVPKHR